jgi:hypothetical protein
MNHQREGEPLALDRAARKSLRLYTNNGFSRKEKGMMCRHCNQVRANRPRGLCWSCYSKPGVRELYPSTSKYARRGVGNSNGKIHLPAEPTSALPGTPEKVAVLEERVRLGVSLWHPLDAHIDVRDELAVEAEVA